MGAATNGAPPKKSFSWIETLGLKEGPSHGTYPKKAQQVNGIDADLLATAAPVNPEAARNDWADRLAELFDKAEDGSNQTYWLLLTAEELRAGLKEIPAAVSDVKELERALDSAAWLHNAAENIESEFETLCDAIRCLESEVNVEKIKT